MDRRRARHSTRQLREDILVSRKGGTRRMPALEETEEIPSPPTLLQGDRMGLPQLRQQVGHRPGLARSSPSMRNRMRRFHRLCRDPRHRGKVRIPVFLKRMDFSLRSRVRPLVNRQATGKRQSRRTRTTRDTFPNLRHRVLPDRSRAEVIRSGHLRRDFSVVRFPSTRSRRHPLRIPRGSAPRRPRAPRRIRPPLPRVPLPRRSRG